MTDQDNSYRPHSPDLNSFQSPFPPPVSHSISYQQPTSPVAHRASYDDSPFFTPQYQRPAPPPSRVPQQYIPPFTEANFDSDMARRSSRIARAADVAPVPAAVPDVAPEVVPEYVPEYVSEYVPEVPEPVPEMKYEEPAVPEESLQSRPGADVEVKTKFPVARIKRIMQADEDVGKVAQVTPIAVCKFPHPNMNEVLLISLQPKHWNSS
ncbi:hypothetical protein MW887_004127 [Aspergillus wentii]|nr:hypothetical protein MW887_004127 [Aspergillus wentii]